MGIVHSQLGLIHAVLATALLVVGALALTARKSRLSRHPAMGNLYFLLLVITLPMGFVVGWQLHPERLSIFQLVTPPTLALGGLGFAMAKLKPKRWLGRPWVLWHIAGQAGSYIGVVTATGFQILPRFLPPSDVLTALLFAAPAIGGGVLINRTIRRRLRPVGMQATA